MSFEQRYIMACSTNFMNVLFQYVMCTHLFIRTRSLVERCVNWVPDAFGVLLLGACRGELSTVIFRLMCRCLCVEELACLPLHSYDQSLLRRGQCRCHKVQIIKLFIDSPHYLLMMQSCTVNNITSQIRNIITRKIIQNLIITIRIWYVIKYSEKSKQKLLSVFFICSKSNALHAYNL